MLKAIRQVLDNPTPNSCDLECQLLDRIQQLGMLPPTIRYNAVNEFENIKDTDILYDYDVSFAWRDEDEA